ncbi:MAG: ABC transporter substrate-binding protein, partial [Nocardioidaceae bacterium]
MPYSINRRRFLTRSGLVVGGVVAGPGLLAACGGGTSGGATDTFKVGAVLELSGASATGGQIAQRGYQLWADTVNKAGGLNIGGKKYDVELIVQDCQSDPATGASATAQLATEEGVNAIFGAYTSGVQIAMNPICEKYRVPCIAGSAESPENWTPQPAFTYGIIPAVDTTAARSIQAIVDTASPTPTTAAVVGANEPFSDDTAEGFRAGVEDAGLEVVHYSLFPPNADLAPVADVVAAEEPDIVAVGGHDVLLVDFVKAMASTGFTPKAIIEHYGITDAS